MTQTFVSDGSRRRSGSTLPDLRRYRLVVFDLDGTLYHQGPVRRAMLSELLLSPRGADGSGRLGRLSVLRRFRQMREEFARTAPKDYETPLFSRLSEVTGLEVPTLRRLVREWMEERPLRRVRTARVRGASDLFDALRGHGIQIAIWSDYPVPDKLAALDLRADHAVSASDPDVAALKPNPAGLRWLLERTGIAPEDTLMVGDRDSHDGAASRAAGVDFLLRARRGPPGIPRVHDFCGLVAQMRQDQS